MRGLQYYGCIIAELQYQQQRATLPAAALAVHDEIERTAGLLRQNLRLGRPGRVEDTRELEMPTYPAYILVYEWHGNRLHILAVLHDRQQWPGNFEA